MTKEECFELEGTPLVLLKDKNVGMFLVYPIGTGDREGICGIQVHGEEEHRWIHCSNIIKVGGGLIEV